MSFFQKAEKRKAWLKLALTGPSGSGKTMSALKLAEGLANKPEWKIGLIDTEAKSASLYADRFEFFTADIFPPYSITKYTEAIDQAEKAGVDVLIIDSITHAWAGEGGLLALKESMDARGGNSYANWAKITPMHEKFKAKILSAQMHVICTMRSKQDYILEANDKGKQAPRKVGLAPVQREGMEYEFTTVFDIGMNHEATPSKDRTGLFDGEYFQIEKKHGELLRNWLEGSEGELVKTEPKKEFQKVEKPVVSHNGSTQVGNHALTEDELKPDVTFPFEEPPVKYISPPQQKRLFAISKQANWPEDEVRSLILKETGQGSTSHIPWTKYDAIWKFIEANPK